MVPLGLVGLGDELRTETRATLAACTAAGVAPKVISGDNPATVAALARQAGFGAEARLVSGLELEQMSAAAFAQRAEEAMIFGRIAPQQKEVPMAQTALVTFLVYCGLVLVIFVAPPTQGWASGELSGDWRPTLLAVALMLVFLVISALPALRTAFALQPLERPYALLTIVALGIWLFLVRLFWHRRLIERFLGVSEKQ